MSGRALGGLLAGIVLAASLALPGAVSAYEQPFIPNPPVKGDEAQVKQQQTQPLNNAPMWRDVRSSDVFITQVRGVETGVLVQPWGETWREIRNGPISLYGGVLILAVPILIGLFYAWKGPMRVHGQPTGRMILRLTPWDRIIHWSVALSWLALAITGLIILFGKHVLLPIVGHSMFSWLAIAGKNLHNFVGPLFFLSTIAMFVSFVSRNVPRAGDLTWLARAGRTVNGQHAPSGFFNAGEKIVFWVGLTIFGIVVSLSGFVLNFPNFDQGRQIMQLSHMIHSITAILFMAMMMGHIYMGSIGVEGAYKAMRYDGLVDEAWAKEHHPNWQEEVKAGKASHGMYADQAAQSGGTVPQSSRA